MNWKKTVLICTVILLGGVAVTAAIYFSEPTARREGATRKSAMLVEVVEADAGTFRPTIVAMGMVRPAQEIVLSPRVGGEVIELAPAFMPGGHVGQGTPLLYLDPSDFRNVVQQRKSDLQQAIADLNLELGRQKIAEQDYRLLGEELSAENEALILRQPQLNIARARVETARAALRQAELDLQRTTVKAPFDAHILNRIVNVGSHISAGDPLGRLVGIENYWVETTVPVAKLRWISFPDSAGRKGTSVKIYNKSAWPEGTFRTGHVTSLIGALEERTRMARLLVSVSDPLALLPESRGKPPLVIGSFVEAHIKAKEIASAVRLNRDYIRQGNTVWVMEEDKLRIRDVKIAFLDATYGYIEEGLRGGELVVATDLATVTEGVELRREQESPPAVRATGIGSKPEGRDDSMPGSGG